jgi:hypothetical protein
MNLLSGTFVGRLVVVGVLPFVVYTLLRPHVRSDAVALTFVIVIPLSETIFELVRKRKLEPLGATAVLAIVLGLIATLVTSGDTTALKMRTAFVAACPGIACLISLIARRPAMFYIAREMEAGENDVSREAFDERWGLAGLPRYFRVLTLLWGLGLLIESGIVALLALRLSTAQFLLGSEVASWIFTLGLLSVTIAYASHLTRSAPLAVLGRSIAGRSNRDIETEVTKMGGAQDVLDMRFDVLTHLLNPSAARDCTVGYVITDGADRYTYVIRIRQGVATVENCEPVDAESVIMMSLPDTLRLAVGQLDAREAFASGSLVVDGDLQLAIDFRSMFRA